MMASSGDGRAPSCQRHNANGMIRIASFRRSTLSACGFSNVAQVHVEKNPPPLGASCLIATWLATGRLEMSWGRPPAATVRNHAGGCWRIAYERQRKHSLRCGRGLPKLPSVLARAGQTSDGAASTHMPADAETKVLHGQPQVIWVK